MPDAGSVVEWEADFGSGLNGGCEGAGRKKADSVTSGRGEGTGSSSSAVSSLELCVCS